MPGHFAVASTPMQVEYIAYANTILKQLLH